MKTPQFSTAALENIQETGTEWSEDLIRLNAGEITVQALLAECLNGANDDRAQGWQDYVAAIADLRDTREAYIAAGGTVEFENSALSIGNEFLPPFARVVRDGGEPVPAYWTWLLEQLNDVSRETHSGVAAWR